jgi:uncharacterized protein
MWTKLTHTVIKFRLPFIIVLGLITLFMAWHAKDIEMDYDHAQLVPSTDPDYQQLKAFKALFGDDGNILALGIKDSALYTPENFRRFSYLIDAIGGVKGVNGVLGLPNFRKPVKDTENRRFVLKPAFTEIPDSQAELDSLLQQALNIKFFANQLVNPTNGATAVIISLDVAVINSAQRMTLMADVIALCEEFSKHTGIEMHYGGLPYVRTVMMTKVRQELQLFLLLSIIITATILLLFFRSWDAVVFPMLVILSVVIWSLGTLQLFGFKITILTGLIPTIIVVIGIPNSIYLINKYHQEFDRHGNKMKALSTMTRKIGLVTLITNFTTAVGFLVLTITDIRLLREFGLVTGINILATFVVSIILIPAVFSYLPSPGRKQLKHLHFKGIDGSLSLINYLVHNKRSYIYAITAVLVVIGAVGTLRIHSVSYMVDDLPETGKTKQDLYFFEENFSGVMPLEVVVDTGNKRGATRLNNLRKVNELEEFLSQLAPISEPVSVVGMIKASRQAYYNDNPAYFSLPNNQDFGFIMRYLQQDEEEVELMRNFMDSSMQQLRISLKVADIGSYKMDSLVGQVIQPKVDEIFGENGMEVTITGTMPIFIKGNKYLIENLQLSLLLAFVIIAIIMGILFSNKRMIILSLIPNMIPLLLVAGMMGYFGIPLKPSTALIFSIAFGISVDDSIHFLAKYRQELFASNFFVPIAISKSLRETGTSMMYTSIVLFFGFVIFAGSEFGGTVALGVLTSTTLLIAMLTNLIVLPSLLLTFDDGKRKMEATPLIAQYDYDEDEDENQDFSKLTVEKNGEDSAETNEFKN